MPRRSAWLLFFGGVVVGVIAVLLVTGLQPQECMSSTVPEEYSRLSARMEAGWVVTRSPASGAAGIYCVQRPLLPSSR
jgi:hypothetical protein